MKGKEQFLKCIFALKTVLHTFQEKISMANQDQTPIDEVLIYIYHNMDEP